MNPNPLEMDMLAVAQVYATLSAAYRMASVTTQSVTGMSSYNSLRGQADQYESQALAALRAAGLRD